MGLDWIVENKSTDNPNEKYEFYRLKHKLKLLYDQLYKETNQENIYEIEEKIEELENEFNYISIKPSHTVENLSEEDIITLTSCIVGGSFIDKDYDFRGKVIGQSDILEEDLKMEAYENHNPEQCIEYAVKLEIFIEQLNKNDLDEDEEEDYDYLLKAIKWLKFWGCRGHGYCACY